MLEIPKLTGIVEISVFRNNKLYSFERGSNLIVTVGKAHIVGLLNGVVSTPFKYIAVGTSATGAVAGDIALVDEILGTGLARSVGSVSRVTSGGGTLNDTARILVIFNVTGNATVQECGLFDTPVIGGVMCSRYIPTPTSVINNDTLQVKWDIKAA